MVWASWTAPQLHKGQCSSLLSFSVMQWWSTMVLKRIQRSISGRAESKQPTCLFAQSEAFTADCEQYYVRVTYSTSFSYQVSGYLTWRSSARSVSRRDSHTTCFLRVLIILQKYNNIVKEWDTILSDWKNRRKLQVLLTVCAKETLELLSGFV